ncbi:hypothetical protein F5B21DRAFT_107060 [Xylaria acuta]|nr:hypothetical protein F5B21DRAFT_107060 [Xylaria acuta]
MVREATSRCQPTSRCSRSHRHYRYRPETCHCSDEAKSSVSSDTKDWGADGAIQDPVPIISTWSEPVLDTHGGGRFQYQARVTPNGYQWSISGSDSGTNPHFLSSALNPSGVYPLGTLAVTYPPGSYISEQPIQSQPQYYDTSSAGGDFADPLANEESKDYGLEEYYEEEKLRHDKSIRRRNASSHSHRNGGREKQRRHRSHSHSRHRPSHNHHHHHHRRSGSHKNNDHKRHTDRGRMKPDEALIGSKKRGIVFSSSYIEVSLIKFGTTSVMTPRL